MSERILLTRESDASVRWMESVLTGKPGGASEEIGILSSLDASLGLEVHDLA